MLRLHDSAIKNHRFNRTRKRGHTNIQIQESALDLFIDINQSLLNVLQHVLHKICLLSHINDYS